MSMLDFIISRGGAERTDLPMLIRLADMLHAEAEGEEEAPEKTAATAAAINTHTHTNTNTTNSSSERSVTAAPTTSGDEHSQDISRILGPADDKSAPATGSPPASARPEEEKQQQQQQEEDDEEERESLLLVATSDDPMDVETVSVLGLQESEADPTTTATAAVEPAAATPAPAAHSMLEFLISPRVCGEDGRHAAGQFPTLSFLARQLASDESGGGGGAVPREAADANPTPAAAAAAAPMAVPLPIVPTDGDWGAAPTVAPMAIPLPILPSQSDWGGTRTVTVAPLPLPAAPASPLKPLSILTAADLASPIAPAAKSNGTGVTSVTEGTQMPVRVTKVGGDASTPLLAVSPGKVRPALHPREREAHYQQQRPAAPSRLSAGYMPRNICTAMQQRREGEQCQRQYEGRDTGVSPSRVRGGGLAAVLSAADMRRRQQSPQQQPRRPHTTTTTAATAVGDRKRLTFIERYMDNLYARRSEALRLYLHDADTQRMRPRCASTPGSSARHRGISDTAGGGSAVATVSPPPRQQQQQLRHHVETVLFEAEFPAHHSQQHYQQQQPLFPHPPPPRPGADYAEIVSQLHRTGPGTATWQQQQQREQQQLAAEMVSRGGRVLSLRTAAVIHASSGPAVARRYAYDQRLQQYVCIRHEGTTRPATSTITGTAGPRARGRPASAQPPFVTGGRASTPSIGPTATAVVMPLLRPRPRRLSQPHPPSHRLAGGVPDLMIVGQRIELPPATPPLH